MTVPATPQLPILPTNTAQQPAPAAPGSGLTGLIPPGGIGYLPNAILFDRLYTYGFDVPNEDSAILTNRDFLLTVSLMARYRQALTKEFIDAGLVPVSASETYQPLTPTGQTLYGTARNLASPFLAVCADAVLITAGPNYLTRDVGIAASYYPAYIAYVIGQAFTIAFEPARVLVVNTYNSQATAINNNPTVQNPMGAVNGAILTATTLVNSTLTTVSNAVTAAQAEAGRQIAAATLLAGSVQAQVTALVDAQVAFVTNTLTALQTQLNAALTNAQATVDQQRVILEAEAKKQQDAANAVVTKAQADAGAAVADATARATATLTFVQAEIARIGTLAIAEITRVIGVVNSTTQDRPLYHGALTTSVTVNGPTDVVVIPAGGLVITAD